MLGVSNRDIVVGDRAGLMVRFNSFGLERREFRVTGGDGNRNGFTLPPLLLEDGCLIAASESGTVVFFGPRSDAAPLERTLPFRAAPILRAFMLVGPQIVGISASGEVQSLAIDRNAGGQS
jgi:hypothetical protein